MNYSASISQNSGEDWKDIDLELSTSKPNFFNDLPTLQPWYIQKYQSRIMRDPMASDVNMHSMASEIDSLPPQRGMKPQGKFLAFDEASILEQGSNMIFQIPYPVNVRSIDASQNIQIAGFHLPVTRDFVVFPRISEEALIRVKLKNKSEYALLSGEATLNIDKTFLGYESIRFIPVEGEYDLNFGVDQLIKVKRELVRQDLNKKVFQDRVVNQIGYKLSIFNPTSQPISVEVSDQFPVSRNEEINVRLDDVKPQPHSIDELNRMLWKLTIPSMGSTEILFRFVVEAPKDVRVSGLPLL